MPAATSARRIPNDCAPPKSDGGCFYFHIQADEGKAREIKTSFPSGKKKNANALLLGLAFCFDRIIEYCYKYTSLLFSVLVIHNQYTSWALVESCTPSTLFPEHSTLDIALAEAGEGDIT